jgi:hypothetical protein
LQFPGNREIYREFRDFAAFGGRFLVKSGRAAANFAKFPVKINRENFANIRERNRDIRELDPRIRARRD